MGSAQESLFEPENTGPLPPPTELVMKQAEIKSQLKQEETDGMDSQDNFNKDGESLVNEIRAFKKESDILNKTFKERPRAAGENK